MKIQGGGASMAHISCIFNNFALAWLAWSSSLHELANQQESIDALFASAVHA
jgi:hypothetical protein